jgi:hypothetical protein
MREFRPIEGFLSAASTIKDIIIIIIMEIKIFPAHITGLGTERFKRGKKNGGYSKLLES